MNHPDDPNAPKGARVEVHARPQSAAEEALELRQAQAVTITDKRGRVIVLRRPGVLAQYRLIEALGNEAASNQTYVGMVLPLLYVESIDRSPAPTASKRQIEALIERLGDEGIEAVGNGVIEHFGRRSPDEERAELKK